MELWIRTQNKGALIKVEILGNTDGTINAYSNDNKIVLGEYSSNKRALEVLDEIQKLLNPQQLLVVRKDFDNEAKIELLGARQSGITQMENSKIDFYQYSSYVYEMPEK